MMFRLGFSLFFASLLATSTVSAKKKDANLNLLMLGNSFSEAHKLEETLQSMLAARQSELGATQVYADRFEHHSANLSDYLGKEVSKAIGKERPWTWVTLQEQSEIPGFYSYSPNGNEWKGFDRSLETVLQLNREIQEAGATTVLFQTWGYFQQDPLNKDIYKNYLEMQDHITRGYEKYHDAILKDNPRSNVQIAPCGMAFNRIHQDIVNQGKDPLEDGSLFDQLYEKNEQPRKHPSAQGAYLCACVLFQTLTGLDVRQSTPPASIQLDAIATKALQEAAYRAVQDYGGDALAPKPPKAYIPESSSTSSSKSGMSSFLFAFLMGGGMVAGWVGWKRRSAAGSLRQQYHLLSPPAAGGDNSMAMELIISSKEPEAQNNWMMNPV